MKTTRWSHRSSANLSLVVFCLGVTTVAPRTSSAAGWLYTQPGLGYLVKNVGVVVYDFEGNEIVLSETRNLVNLAGQRERVSENAFRPTDRLLVKYSPEPASRIIFARQVGAMNFPYFWALATDRAGAIYGAGSYEGTTQLLQGSRVHSLTAQGRVDGLLVKWDATGELVWLHQISGADYKRSETLALDPQGALFVAGEFQGKIDFDAGNRQYHFQTRTNTYDYFLLKMRPGGGYLWAQQLTGAESILPPSVQTDSAGNCLITGGFEGQLELQGISRATRLIASGGWDMFLAKYSPEGELLWARSAGGPTNDYGSRLVVDASGWSYVHGRFGHDAVFGEDANALRLQAQEGADIMVACYDADGEFVAVVRVGGGGIVRDPEWTTVFDELGNRYLVQSQTDPVRTWARSRRTGDARSSQGAGPTSLVPPSAPTGTPACFENIARGPGGSIELILSPGGPAFCLVEVSADLRVWTAVSTNAVRNGKLIITDPQASRIPMRFFRVRQFPAP